MPDMVMLETEEKMDKAIASLKHEFSLIRTGRANPQILDIIFIDYYGVKTPLKQVASVSVPESTQLLIKPYDKSTIKLIEAAISQSELGLNPQSDGTQIRLIIPKLTEERRKEMVKSLSKHAEAARVQIRNVRRDGNDALKKLDLPEDELKGYQEDVQKLTDKYIDNVASLVKEKENELMTI